MKTVRLTTELESVHQLLHAFAGFEDAEYD